MFLFALVMLHMSRPQACHRMTRVQREYMRWLMIQPEKFSHPCWIHKLMILTKGWAPGTVLQPLYLCLHGTLFNRNTLPNPMTKSRYVCGAGIPSLPIGTSLNWVVALDRALCVSLCVTLCPAPKEFVLVAPPPVDHSGPFLRFDQADFPSKMEVSDKPRPQSWFPFFLGFWCWCYGSNPNSWSFVDNDMYMVIGRIGRTYEQIQNSTVRTFLLK